MSINCTSDGACPYVFHCVDEICTHNGIFPLTVYSSFVYLLLVFGVMLSNVGGLSAGIYKVPILMDMLNYPVNVATALSYPIVTGASLANFIQLIPKKHPTRATSLVDYNIVLLLIPCVSFGSTLGAIVVRFIPLLYQDVILFVVFIFLTLFFFLKTKNFKLEGEDQVKPRDSVGLEMTDVGEKDTSRVEQSPHLRNSLIVRDSDLRFRSSSYRDTKMMNEQINQLPKNVREQVDNSVKLREQLQYERTYHVKDIFVSIAVFVVFEILALLAQGKLVPFNFCSATFAGSFGGLVVVFILYLVFVYKFTCKKLLYYAQIGYVYEVRLNEYRNFALITCGGFIGGFLQGVIGVGSGNLMVASLLTVGLNPKVTSATSGYQIVFIGLSSLIEALVNDELNWVETGWFLFICFLFGGGLTFLMYRFLKNKPSAPKVLLVIITCLCVMSTVGIIPSVYLTQKFYGWPYLLTPKKFCS